MKKFQKQLDDPGAFATALHHCHERTGILERYRWMLPPGVEERLKGKTGQPNDIGWTPDSTPDPQWEESPESSFSAQRAETPSGPPTDSKPRSRWDELRAVSARNAASPSSWESLRQTHERQQVSRPEADNQPEMDERALEQAKFDAMLEEERRRAMGLSANE